MGLALIKDTEFELMPSAAVEAAIKGETYSFDDWMADICTLDTLFDAWAIAQDYMKGRLPNERNKSIAYSLQQACLEMAYDRYSLEAN